MKKQITKTILHFIIAMLVSVSYLAAQSPGAAVAKKVGLYVFPANDQTSEQQDKDESDCYSWVAQHGQLILDPERSFH